MTNKADVIMAIVNQGHEEKLMEVAKRAGATGGTFINAHGTTTLDAETFFGITINPEKCIALIIVPNQIKNNVLMAIYDEAGFSTTAQGIAFSFQIDELSDNLKKQLFKEEETNETKNNTQQKSEEE